MPIVIPHGIFQGQPSLAKQAGDDAVRNAEAFLQAKLAKERLEGWREARANDRKLLEMKEQDRAAEMQSAEAIGQFRMGQQGAGAPAALPPGFSGPPAPAQPGGGMEDENAEIQRIASEVTKDPRARLAFLETVKADRQQRAIREGYGQIRDRLQDRILGMSRTPEAAGLVQDFEMLADELEQVGAEGVDPKLAAAIIDDVGRRFDEKSKVVYEHALRERQDQEAMALVDEQMAAMPPGHPMRERMGLLRLGIELGDLDGADVVRSLRAQEMGLQEVEPGVFMDPAKYQQLQLQRQRENRQLREGAERTMRENRALNIREQELQQSREGKKGGPSIGARVPTNDSITRETNAIMEAWKSEGKKGKGFTRDDAYKIAADRAFENWRRGQAEIGGGAPVGPAPQEAEALPPGLEDMTPEERAMYDALDEKGKEQMRREFGRG